MPCLNLQLSKFQNYILYIRNKHSLQLKQISLIKILKIYLCMKKKPNTMFLLWQQSWMPYCIKALLQIDHKYQGHILSLSMLGKTWNSSKNLNYSSLYDVFVKQA